MRMVTFRNALAVWHMRDERDSIGEHHLAVHGEVKLGVALKGGDREESMKRGGDGKAALFEGGYLTVKANNGILNVPGQTMTFAIRLCDPEGKWQYPIFGSYGNTKQVSFFLHSVDGTNMPRFDRNFVGHEVPTVYSWMFGSDNGPRSIHGSKSLIEFIWGAKQPDTARMEIIKRAVQDAGTDDFPLCHDIQNAVQRICFPVQTIGPEKWHDLIVRFTGPKLQLFIDGILVDEEYPIGKTRENEVPCMIGAAYDNGMVKSGFRGLIDHVALWSRALTDQEIVDLSGGDEYVRNRKYEILGKMPSRMQYFRPLGHNSKAGDCIPFWHDETFHLFYLVLRRNMHSKWDGGHGGLEIHHASTKDLVNWKHHTLAVAITEQWESFHGTGGLAWHNGKFYMFYPTPSYNKEYPYGGIQLATSSDGDNFTKEQPHPFISGGDCEIYHEPETGLFHMLKQGRETHAPIPSLIDKTLVVWASLDDLDQRGGSALTIQDNAGHFDAIAYSEVLPQHWMMGSENLTRTQRDQTDNIPETIPPDEFVQIAMVCQDRSVTLYRNGEQYASYSISQPQKFMKSVNVLIGLRHIGAGGNRFFHGRISDARLYSVALSEEQIKALKPKIASDLKPLAWWNFENGLLTDRMGIFPPAELRGSAHIQNDMLHVGEDGYFIASSGKTSLMRLVSSDLQKWTEEPEPFIVTDAGNHPGTCPHLFEWNGWYYFFGGGFIWQSRQKFGPWTLHTPERLDILGVPKTAAFRDNRRIMAGFLGDAGWGGNLVLRELMQHPDGTLGTKFVPEMIPQSGEPLPVIYDVKSIGAKIDDNDLQLTADKAPAYAIIRGVPYNVRVTLEVVPKTELPDFSIGLRCQANPDESCRLQFLCAEKIVRFSRASDSSNRYNAGPSITHVYGIDKPFALDIICNHDIIDAEIGGCQTLVNRYWDTEGKNLSLIVDKGEVIFRNIIIRPLVETFSED